jgi:hypothetical protein
MPTTSVYRWVVRRCNVPDRRIPAGLKRSRVKWRITAMQLRCTRHRISDVQMSLDSLSMVAWCRSCPGLLECRAEMEVTAAAITQSAGLVCLPAHRSPRRARPGVLPGPAAAGPSTLRLRPSPDGALRSPVQDHLFTTPRPHSQPHAHSTLVTRLVPRHKEPMWPQRLFPVPQGHAIY